jgi:hypothetical protein
MSNAMQFNRAAIENAKKNGIPHIEAQIKKIQESDYTSEQKEMYLKLYNKALKELNVQVA